MTDSNPFGSPQSDPFAALQPLVCPQCGEATESLKQYEVIHRCIFFIAMARIQTAFLIACPRCMRNMLWWRLWANILMANLLWPVYIVPRTIFLIMCSHTLGHSRSISQQLRGGSSSQDKPFGTN